MEILMKGFFMVQKDLSVILADAVEQVLRNNLQPETNIEFLKNELVKEIVGCFTINNEWSEPDTAKEGTPYYIKDPRYNFSILAIKNKNVWQRIDRNGFFNMTVYPTKIKMVL